MSGGTNALSRPAVREQVERLFAEELQGEILPLALKRHKQVLLDPDSAGPTLTKALELAYKHGFSKREDGDKDPDQRSTADMLTKAQQIIEEANAIGRLMIEAKVVEEVRGGGAGEAAVPAGVFG